MEPDSGLGSIAQFQPPKQAGDMVFHGFFGDVEPLGDLPITGSLGN
jgi:hypothetical protein